MTVTAFLEKYAEVEKKKAPMGGFQMNRPLVQGVKGDVGLELEIEANNLPNEGDLAAIIAPDTKSRWLAKADGSLRGEAIEYVLSKPANIDEVPTLLGGLWDKFRQHKTKFNLSNRCSTHVHVNMTGYKINQITSVIALWTTLEEVLINWCGEERKTNHFCLSAKDSAAIIQRWNSFLHSGRMDYPEGFKYTALNVRTLPRIGSLEFRCMRASENPEDILDWTKFVNGMVKYAANNYVNPHMLASDLSEMGGIVLFTNIARESGCSPAFIGQVLNHDANRDFHAQTMEGFRIAQPIVLGHAWHEWMDNIQKEYIPDPFNSGKGGAFYDGTGAAPAAEPRFRPEGRPMGAADRLIRTVAEGAPRARGARAIDPELPRLPRLNRNIGYRIDADAPIEFIDGTPAEVQGQAGNRGITVRATRPLWSTDATHDLSTFYTYDRSTGFWSGDWTVGQIRNVGSLPFLREE